MVFSGADFSAGYCARVRSEFCRALRLGFAGSPTRKKIPKPRGFGIFFSGARQYAPNRNAVVVS